MVLILHRGSQLRVCLDSSEDFEVSLLSNGETIRVLLEAYQMLSEMDVSFWK